MKLPLSPPYPPMEARAVDSIPSGPEWRYEPKWDGFRCLAFREGNAVELQSKSGQPLARYFPDIVAALQALRPTRFVLDGEIVIPVKGELSFDELLLRIHPAASRVNKLAKEHPGVFVGYCQLGVVGVRLGRFVADLPDSSGTRYLLPNKQGTRP